MIAKPFVCIDPLSLCIGWLISQLSKIVGECLHTNSFYIIEYGTLWQTVLLPALDIIFVSFYYYIQKEHDCFILFYIWINKYNNMLFVCVFHAGFTLSTVSCNSIPSVDYHTIVFTFATLFIKHYKHDVACMYAVRCNC